MAANAPAVNASRAKWVEYFAVAYKDVDTDDMSRQDMIEVHKLRKAGSPPDSEAAQRPGLISTVPADRIDTEVPSLDDVPEHLRFSTDTGEDRDIERVPIALDGRAFWLYRPSDAALTLYLNQLLSDDVRMRSNAMTTLVQQVLDPSGVMYLMERITDKANNFDDTLYMHVVANVLELWAEDTAAVKFRQVQEAETQNRAQRRAAARAKK